MSNPNVDGTVGKCGTAEEDSLRAAAVMAVVETVEREEN